MSHRFIPRELFLKILFRRTLKYAVYLLGSLLLSTIVYPIIAARIGATPAILIITLVVLMAGWVYYLAHRPELQKKIEEDIPLFVTDLLQLLQRRLDKEALKPELESLLNQYQKPPLYGLWQDLKYHLGLFKPTSHDYRFKDKVYSFDDGISYYIGRLETMLLTGNFAFNKNESLYELYLRWLFHEGDYVEVEQVDSGYMYTLFKGVGQDDYYFDLPFGSGILTGYETRKVSDLSLKGALKTAIQKKDKLKIQQISQYIREVQ